MIQVEGLSKQYVDQVLFEDATFYINRKERVGLVGRNGHGKTTLFRILVGQEEADRGTIRIPKGYRIGYLSQQCTFTAPTVLAEGCLGLPPGQELEEWKVEKTLMGLGFSEEDFERSPTLFSGGFQLRINLAKALVNEPDLLLLDEPTNFLDIISIRWMVRFLNSWPGELLLISHDRHFMDAVVTQVMGIHRQKVKKVPGTTGDYYNQIAIEETFYEQARRTEEKKREQATQFIDRFRAQATKARQVQSRLKALERTGTKAKLDRIADLSFSFPYAPFSAKVMLHAHNLTFSYPGQAPLFSDLSLSVEKQERVCIIGKNGKGKTTLLKVLHGLLAPQRGTVKTHPSLIQGYFEQANTADLSPHRTVAEEILSVLPKKSLQEARKLCGLMMFTRDQALKTISVLSGGEKARVLLGKLLAAPAHVLLLDEPTHHLDMQASEAMAEAIAEYAGAAIVVTHDEQFLREVATKLVVFHEDRVFVYEGGYDAFLREIGWGDEAGMSSRPPQMAGDSKQDRRERAFAREARDVVLKPLEAKVKELEKQIALWERDFSQAQELMLKASVEQDGEKIVELSRKMHSLREKIDFGYLDLEAAMQERDQARKTHGV